MAGNKRIQKKRGRSDANREGLFNVHWKSAKGAFEALWHRPIGNILTLAVISMALAMPACLYLMGKNIASVAENAASSPQVSAYLLEGVPEARIMVLKDEIEGWPTVSAVEYISSQQGLDDLSQHAGFEDAISLLDGYALPSVLILTPTAVSKQEMHELAAKVRGLDSVTDVRMDEDWLSRFDAIKTLASISVVVLTTLMLIAVFLIIGNTLRFNVLANKEEIQTMKLIGATDSYILRPYLYSGIWLGVLGASVAWLMTFVITLLLSSAVDNLAALYDSHFHLVALTWDESLLLLITGSLLGCVAAQLSALRHLREIEPV